MADDLRQNIVIALQQQGIDAADLVKRALADVVAEQGRLNREASASPAAFREAQAGLAKLQGEYNRLLAVLYELHNQKMNPDMAGMQQIDVGINKLIQSGLNLQSALAKLGDTDLSRLAKEFERSLAAADKAAAAMDKVATSAASVHSDRLDAAVAALERLRAASAAAGKPTAELDAQLASLRGTQAEAVGSAVDRLRAAMIQAGQSTADLDQKVKGLTVAQIEAMTRAAREAQVAFDATFVSVGKLADSAGKVKSDRIVELSAAVGRYVEALKASGAAVASVGDYLDNAMKRGMTPADIDARTASWVKGKEKQDEVKAATDRLRESLEKAGTSTAGLDAKLKGLDAAKIDALTASHEKARKATEASAVSTDQLAASGKNVQSGQIDKLEQSIQKYNAAAMAAGVPTAALDSSIKGLTPATVDAMTAALERDRKALEATVVATDKLGASAAKITSAEMVRYGEAVERLQKHFVAAGGSVAAFDAQIRGLSPQKVIAMDAALTAGQKATGDAMRARIDAMALAERQTDKWRDSMRKLDPQFDAASRQSKAFAFALLNVSHAAQDAQYGFGALVNNIPLIVHSTAEAIPAIGKLADKFGGPAGLAGTAMLAGVAIDILSRRLNLGPIFAQLATDFNILDNNIGTFVTTVQGAQARVEALKFKPLKLEVDYRELAEAERRLAKMQKDLQAFESGRVDKPTQEAAKQAKEVGDSFMGGSEGIAKAVAEINATRGVSFASAEDEKKIARAKKFLDDFAASPLAEYNPAALAGRAYYTNVLNKTQEEVRRKAEQAAQLEAGAFERGDFGAITRMQGRARQFPGAFARVGPGGERADEAIANLPRSREEAAKRIEVEKEFEELEKEDKEFEQRTARIKAKAKSEAQKVKADIAETVQGVKAAFFDALVDDLYAVAEKKGDVGEAAAGARAGLIEKIKARGVSDAKVAAGAADEILATAKETAINAATSGEDPKLVRRREAEKKKQDAKDEAERKRLEREQRKEVVEGVRRFAPGIEDDLERTMLGHIGQGATPEQSAGRLTPQIARNLRDRGADPAEVDNIAAAIMRKVSAAVDNELAQANLPRPMAAQQAFGARLGKMAVRDEADANRIPNLQRRQFRQGQQFNQQAAQQQFAARAMQIDPRLNQQQAQDAGRKAVGRMQKGQRDPDAALQAAINEVLMTVQHLQVQAARNAAALQGLGNNMRSVRQQQGQGRMRRGPVGAGWFGPMAGIGG